MSHSTRKSASGRLLSGALILVPAALLSKLVGLFYKIPLVAIVGVGGMAYFLAAYHVYSFLFVLCATGLSTALSLLVARAAATGQRGAVGRVLRVSLVVFLIIGFAGTSLLLCFAPWLAERLSMREATASLLAVAPSLFLSALIGAVKGYFQGLGNMLPTAVSEALEALGKLVFGLLLATWAQKRALSTDRVAACAILGITAGLALAALVMLVWLVIDRLLRRKREQGLSPTNAHKFPVLRPLLRESLPITLGASVVSLVALLDTALISARLQAAGFSLSAAHTMYSGYGNLAVPLYNLVPALLGPLVLSLTPLLGASFAAGEQGSAAEAFGSARRITLLIALPATLGFAVFAGPILQMIYGTSQSAVSLATPLLTLLSLAVLPTAYNALTAAALQAAGKPQLPMLSTLCGIVVKLLVEWFLLAEPSVHIFAAPIGTLLCHLTVLILQSIALRRTMPFACPLAREAFSLLLCSALSIGGGVALSLALSPWQATWRWRFLPPLALVAVLYPALVLCLGVLRKEDLYAMPLGRRICPILERCKLLK